MQLWHRKNMRVVGQIYDPLGKRAVGILHFKRKWFGLDFSPSAPKTGLSAMDAKVLPETDTFKLPSDVAAAPTTGFGQDKSAIKTKRHNVFGTEIGLTPADTAVNAEPGRSIDHRIVTERMARAIGSVLTRPIAPSSFRHVIPLSLARDAVSACDD
jgi:hypothetical protein